MKPDEIDVVNRGNWLQDTKTLREYGFENKVTVMVYLKSKPDEGNDLTLAIPLPPSQ